MKRREDDNRVALVTGADRGIGYATCRRLGEMGYLVVLTSPTAGRGKAALAKLVKDGLDAFYHPLDVMDDRQIAAIRQFVVRNIGRIDVLVNNAGVMLDSGRSRVEGVLAKRLGKAPRRQDFGEGRGILDADIDIVQATFEINTLGPLKMCQAFIPMMMKAGYGRVVNVSSSLGQLNGMTDGEKLPAYQLSKAALNAVTLMAADACRGSNVAVNSVCPGWTRTDIGGPEAPQSPEEAAETIVWLAAQRDGGPTGGFFRYKRRIVW